MLENWRYLEVYLFNVNTIVGDCWYLNALAIFLAFLHVNARK